MTNKVIKIKKNNKVINIKDRIKNSDEDSIAKEERERLINNPGYKLFLELRFKLHNTNLPLKNVKQILSLLAGYLPKPLPKLALEPDIFEKTLAAINIVKTPDFNPAQICDGIYNDIVVGWNQGLLEEGDIISLIRTILVWHNIDLGKLK